MCERYVFNFQAIKVQSEFGFLYIILIKIYKEINYITKTVKLSTSRGTLRNPTNVF